MSASLIPSVKLDGQSFASPGLGLMSIGHIYGHADESESKALLKRAIEIGCVFWDTSDTYGAGGISERIIGEFFQENPGSREKVFLATKFGIEWDRETKQRTGKARGDEAYVRLCIKESTERLHTVPDLYYQHRQDLDGADVEETWRTLRNLQQEGKVKALGVSEVSPATLRRILKVVKVSALQIEYSPFETQIERNGVRDICREHNIALVAYAPTSRGLLTGRWKSFEDVKDDYRGQQWPRFSEENFGKNYLLVEKLMSIAERKGCTPAQLSIAWVSAQGPDVIPIPGTRKVKNLEENFAAREVKLSDEELKEIRELIDGHETAGQRYPKAMQAMLDKGLD